MPYAEVRGKPNIMQFFGDKYGDVVRIVQIGGHDKALDGFSMELCGGTHTKTTGEIGLFKIMRESAIAAGIRRVEAVCGQFAQEFIEKQGEQEKAEAEKAKAREMEKELAKQRQAAMQSQAPAIAEQLLAQTAGQAARQQSWRCKRRAVACGRRCVEAESDKRRRGAWAAPPTAKCRSFVT